METDLIERALQIAPECASIIEVKRRLIREGYEQVNAQLSSRQIRNQIVARLSPRSTHAAPKSVPRLGSVRKDNGQTKRGRPFPQSQAG